VSATLTQKGRRGRRLKRRRSTLTEVLLGAWALRERPPLSPITARYLPRVVLARIADLECWPAEVRASYGLATGGEGRA
jgi:hypothetical protein